MTLVLPAPFGPSRPITSPRPTVNDTSSTAVRRRYRLRRPEHHAAGEGGRSASSCSGASGRGHSSHLRSRATDSTSSALSEPPTTFTKPWSTQITPAIEPFCRVSTVAGRPLTSAERADSSPALTINGKVVPLAENARSCDATDGGNPGSESR